MDKKNQIMTIVKIIVGIAVVAAIFVVGWRYMQVSQMFQKTVPIVAADEYDEEILKITKQKTKPEEGKTVLKFTTGSQLGFSDIGFIEVTTALYQKEQQDKTVDNRLLVLDGSFYLFTLRENEQQLYLAPIDGKTLMLVQGYGWASLTKAYELGGVGCVVNTVNQNLGLDINEYILVNTSKLSNITDYLGGAEVSLSKKEADALNKSLGTQYTAGKNVMWTGGLQSYINLATVGNSLDRWEKAYEAILEKVEEADQAGDLRAAWYQSVLTNLSYSELKDVKTLLLNGAVTEYKLPATGEYQLLDGEYVLVTELKAESANLQKILY